MQYARKQQLLACVLLVVLGGVAWWLSPRLRIATAWGVACLLMLTPATWVSGGSIRRSLFHRSVQWLSTVSYSVFLIHFGVSLAVSALVTSIWPADFWANALGMVMSLLLSVVGGSVLYRLVEAKSPSMWRWWLWAGVFKASVAFAMLLNPAG